MLIIKHSIKTRAKPEAVWALWSRIDTWPAWDHGIQDGKIEGSFVTGAQGWLKPKGGPKVSFQLIEVVENIRFHSRSFLPLTQLDFIHTLERDGDSTVVTHHVEMKGLLTFIFSKVIGSGIKKDMPLAMAKLVEMAVKQF
jgi:hypothetical protein